MKTKEDVERLISFMDKKQVDLVYNLLYTFIMEHNSKGDIAKLVMPPDSTYDTALPHPYVVAIQKLHPNFDVHMHVYDYRTAKFGEIFNLAEGLIHKLRKELVLK